MSGYVDELRRAQFHAKECVKSIRKAAHAIGVDPDEPTVFDDELPDNPEGKRAARLRLVREFAARRYW
jgi:hypothetical protein